MPATSPAEPSVTTRPARGPDRAATWALVQEFAESFTPEAHAFSSSFDHCVEDDRTLVAVAETTDREIVGYLLAHLQATFFANSDVCWVEEVMVAEPRRRTGIGRELMAAAEAWASDRGAAYVCLATRRAHEFYRAARYEESAQFYKKSTQAQ